MSNQSREIFIFMISNNHKLLSAFRRLILHLSTNLYWKFMHNSFLSQFSFLILHIKKNIFEDGCGCAFYFNDLVH